MNKQFPEKNIQIAFRRMKMFCLTHSKRNANLGYHEFSFFLHVSDWQR